MDIIKSTSAELYRRIILILAVLAGFAMIGYNVPTGDIVHPYKSMGIMVLAGGFILAHVLPRRRPEVGDLSYGWFAINVIDFMGIMLLLLFYSLPILINGGWTQVFTRWWLITIVFWVLGAVAVFIEYFSAWNASYCLKFRPNSLVRVTFKGVERYGYDEIESLQEAVLVYPKWFRRMHRFTMRHAVLPLRKMLPSAEGKYLPGKNASYAGLVVRKKDGRQMYIWYKDQYCREILSGYQQVIKECRNRNIPYYDEPVIVKGFMYFK